MTDFVAQCDSYKLDHWTQYPHEGVSMRYHVFAWLVRNARYISAYRTSDRRIARRMVRQLRRLGRPAYFRRAR